MKILCIFLEIILALSIVNAQAEDAWKMDVEIVNEHVSGSITGKSYTFDIDALLLQNAPDNLYSIMLRKIDLSKNNVTEAVAKAFQMSGEQADKFVNITNEGFEGREEQPFPILLHGGSARKPKASEQQLDETLTARLNSCKCFLDDLGIAYDATPFTACYVDTAKNTNNGTQQLLVGLSEAKSAKGPLYVEVVLLLSSEGLPFAPRIDHMRFGGKLRQQPNEKTIFQFCYAGFLFDEKGKLRRMDVALPKGQPQKQIPGQLIPWEKAVETFIQDYTAIQQIQKVLTHVRFCITDIRLVWAVDGDNYAVPAWFIGMSGFDSDLASSGQTYDRRQMSALIYAVK